MESEASPHYFNINHQPLRPRDLEIPPSTFKPQHLIGKLSLSVAGVGPNLQTCSRVETNLPSARRTRWTAWSCWSARAASCCTPSRWLEGSWWHKTRSIWWRCSCEPSWPCSWTSEGDRWRTSGPGRCNSVSAPTRRRRWSAEENKQREWITDKSVVEIISLIINVWTLV